MIRVRNAAAAAAAKATVAGGYTLITGTALLAAWWAYKQRTIRLADLRAWFACCELIAQRRASGAKSRFRPDVRHVSHLAGISEPTARATLRRLTKAGILRWSDGEFSIPAAITLPGLLGDDRFHHALSQVPHHERRVPIPRRMLRLLAGSTRPVFIATTLGHALRCLFLRGGRVAPAGLCKAAWITGAFGVDERNVKAARRELIASGWLHVDSASQRFLNRWGLPVRVNLDWAELASQSSPSDSPTTARLKSPPLGASHTVESPPPLRNNYRLQRSKNHVPQRESGVRQRWAARRPAPFLNVQLEDLRSNSRLRVLFEATVRTGLLRNCEADELRFAAVAERAISKGTSNPAGFFAAVVRRGLWHVISQRDEDAARQRLFPRQVRVECRTERSLERIDSMLSGLVQALRRGAGDPAESGASTAAPAAGYRVRPSEPPHSGPAG